MNTAAFFGEALWSIVANVAAFGIVAYFLYRWIRNNDDPRGTLIRLGWSVALVIGMFAFWVMSFRIGSRGETFGGPAIAFIVAGSAGALGIALTILWGERIGGFVATLITGAMTGGRGEDTVPPPLYSIAEAHRKRGAYPEAIAEIQRQLERHPNDFSGLMMLAEVQAENLKDLAAVRQTIDRVVALPGHGMLNLAFALNRLADWELKVGEDPAMARLALDRIVQMFPATASAQLAEQRIAHLASPEFMADRKARRPIPVPHAEPDLGLRSDPRKLRAPSEDPARLAGDYVRRLQTNPHDFETREQLAIVYAEHYHRVDLATDQLEQLVAAPGAPPKLVVRWLNKLADVQVQEAGDLAAAQRALQRVIERYAGSAAAEQAQHRLAHLRLEMRIKEKSHVVRLGT